MSNYHILRADDDARAVKVVFHLAVPNENNAVGVNIQLAVSQDTEVDKVSIVPGITQGESNQLTDGELIEYVLTYRLADGETAGQAQAALDTKFSNAVTLAANRLRSRYKFWGFARDVP